MDQLPPDFTALLGLLSQGDRDATEQVTALAYQALRKRAAALMKRESPGHTLQPTALVHEAFVGLVGQHSVNWQDRAHFLAIASQVMRRILLMHARAKRTAKRGAQASAVSFDEKIHQPAQSGPDFVAIDAALKKLAQRNERQAKVVELRIFGGMSGQEIALVLGVSRPTVERDWAVAKAWLHRELAGEQAA